MKQLYSLLIYFIFFVPVTCIAQKQGREKIDSLFTVLKTAKTDTAKVNTLNQLADEFKSNNPDTAVYFANEAIGLAEKLNFKMGIADANLYLGTAITYKGKYDEALKKLDDALILYNQILNSDKIKDKSKILRQIGRVYNNSGIIYRNKGNYPKALMNYYSSLKITEKIGYKLSIAASYVNIGVIYNHQSNYPEALKNYFKALAIQKELGDKKVIAASYMNIGIIYQNLNNYDEALKNYLVSLKIFEEIGDKKGIASSYSEIGIIYKQQGNYFEALNYHLASIKIKKERGDKAGVGISYNNIGNIYQAQGNFPEALKSYFEALKILEEISDKEGAFISYNNIGNTYTSQKKYTEANQYLQKALSLAIEVESPDLLKEGHLYLTTLDSIQGNYKQAFEHYKKYIIYRDSIFNEESTKKLVQMQMQYDFDKKEAVTKAEQEKKEIAHKAEVQKQKLLRNSIAGGSGILILASLFSFFFYKRKRDAEQKQKETLLSLQVSETEMKALRSQMNPHFIFNALQSIQTFLLSHKSEEANLYLLKFSKLMRAVLENSQHSEVPLKDDMQALELYMQLESIRLTHPFTYQFHIDSNIDEENDPIPPLILQPFVENAIWHGLQYKTGSGHINIYISKKDNALHATVEDNGVGRDMSKQIAQPMLLKKESLGMKLTEERLKVLNQVKQFNARFTITDLFSKDNQPSGTKVELSLPLVA